MYTKHSALSGGSVFWRPLLFEFVDFRVILDCLRSFQLEKKDTKRFDCELIVNHNMPTIDFIMKTPYL